MTDAPAQGTLVCPKCQGAMRTYERSGVTVDQCTECRGVFLDRGELERLIEAEDVHYTEGGQPGPAYVGESGRSGHGGGHQGRGGRAGRKRGGFLGELFD